MPKTFVAQNIVHINPVSFTLVDGAVTEVTCNVNVNYGELGLVH